MPPGRSFRSASTLPSGTFLAVIAAATTLAVIVVLWVYPSATDFAASNPRWQGTRAARAAMGIRGLTSLADLPPEARATALIVVPAALPHPDDLARIGRYLAGGGVLILMDDFGHGNAVLATLKVGARFHGALLADPLFNYRNPRFPRALEMAGQPTAAGVRSIVLNRGTVLVGTEGMTVLAWSSPLSYLDANSNGARDAQEPDGPFPLAAAGAASGGTLVLVADPSLLLNGMVGLADNRAFLQSLFRFAGDGAAVYLDEAHLPRAPLDAAKVWLGRARAFLGRPILAYALVVVGFAVPMFILLKTHGGRP